MDPLDRIDEIIAMVEGARSVPMSRNCILDRAEIIGLLDQLRNELPGEMRRAMALLEERDNILDAGKREADRIVMRGRGRARPPGFAERDHRLRRARGQPAHLRRPLRVAAAARGGRRLRRHRAGQLRAVPDPVAGLDRARPGQDARAAGDRHVRHHRGRRPAAAVLATPRGSPPRASGRPRTGLGCHLRHTADAVRPGRPGRRQTPLTILYDGEPHRDDMLRGDSTCRAHLG